jgi:hypothetical protein
MALTPATTDKAFEREKWIKDVELREREIAIKQTEAAIKAREVTVKESEQNLKARELRLKALELKRSKFTNPLFLAILGATVAATGTAIGAGIAAWSQMSLEQTRALAQQDIERFKADSTLVLEVIKTNNDTAKAKDNLQFLVGTGLIANAQRRAEIAAYLKGTGPVPTLASPTPLPNASQGIGARCTLPSTVDIQKIGAEFEKAWSGTPTFSNVRLTDNIDSATVSADIRIVPLGLVETTLKMAIIINRSGSAVVVNYFFEAPLISRVVVSTLMSSAMEKTAADLSTQLERMTGEKSACVPL